MKPRTIPTDEARKQLPELLERAYRQGQTAVITKRGVPYAALTPLAKANPPKVESLLALRGSGKRCYGGAARHVRKLRAEWD